MASPSLMAGIRGIVFDGVGTLIDPAPSVAEVYAQAAQRQGVGLDRSEVKSRFARHFRNDEVDETRGPLVTDEAGEYLRWRRIVSNVLPEVPEPERAFTELWDYFGRAQAWRCYPDVGPALNHLRAADVALLIGSNFDSRLRGVVAGLPELSGFGISLLISSEFGYRKPHASFYREACARLALGPDEVLFVGDDMENDVLAPRRAGYRALLVDRDGRWPEHAPSVPDLSALTR